MDVRSIKTEMSKILDESGSMGGRQSIGSRQPTFSGDSSRDEIDGDGDGAKECTKNVFTISDPEAKHRLKMIISGEEEQVAQVRNILNWPSSVSYRLKSLLGALLSPSLMMKCLRLPTFAFYSLEALIFLGVILLPVFVLESVFYPIFRLLFGVLYPAYASYKAVRTRDVKKYVSVIGDEKSMENRSYISYPSRYNG